MKNRSLVVLSLICLVFMGGLVLSQPAAYPDSLSSGSSNNLREISYENFDLKVMGAETSEENFHKIVLKGDDSYVKAKNEFANIDSSRSDKKNYFEFNERGETKEARFTTNDQGGTYTINGTTFKVPGNSTVSYKDGELKLPKGAKIKEIKSKSQITGDKLKFKRNGETHEFSGTLNFDKEGQAYLSPNDSLVSKGVKINRGDINGSGNSETLNLFFDGKNAEKHEGSYVSFGDKKLIYEGNKDKGQSSRKLSFNRDNPYVKIEEGDNFAMNVIGNSELSIKSRRDKGLVPEIEGEGKYKIFNDGNVLKKDSNGDLRFPIDVPLNIADTSSTPLVLESEDKKIFFDNFDRVETAPLDADKTHSSVVGGSETKFSSRIKYNYLDKESLERKTGTEIDFQGNITEGRKQVNMKYLSEYLDNSPEEVKKSLDSVSFLTAKDLEASAAPYVSGEVGKGETDLNFLSSGGKISRKTIRHELAHVRHIDIHSEFNSKWVEVSGDYDKVEGDRFNNHYNYKEPFLKEIFGKEETHESAKFGYVRPYGGTNRFEDVATYVGQVVRDPSVFESKIDPDSEDYNEVYRKKLDLLYEYDYITDKEYKNVLKEAGLYNEE